MNGQLDSLTIEIGLEERWEALGHTIAYHTMLPNNSTLHCTNCHIQVTVHVNSLGGWWLSNYDLDKECTG